MGWAGQFLNQEIPRAGPRWRVERDVTLEPEVQAVPSGILCQERESRGFQDGNKSAIVTRLLVLSQA